MEEFCQNLAWFIDWKKAAIEQIEFFDKKINVRYTDGRLLVLGQVLPPKNMETQREPDLPGGKVPDIGNIRRGDSPGKTVTAEERVSSKTAKKEKFHQITGI